MDHEGIESSSEESNQQRQSVLAPEKKDNTDKQSGNKREIIIQKQSEKLSQKHKAKIKAQIDLMQNLVNQAIKRYEADEVSKGKGALSIENQIQKITQQIQKLKSIESIDPQNLKLIIEKQDKLIKMQKLEIEKLTKTLPHQHRMKCHDVLETLYKFYAQINDKDEYLKNLQQYSKKVKRNFQRKDIKIDTIRNQIYKKELKIQFLQTYALFINAQNDTVNIEKAWNLIREYYYKLLEKSEIFFLAFKLPHASVQKKYRTFLMRILFKQIFQTLKSSKNNYQTLAELIQENKEIKHLLYIFAARQSFVYYDQQLKTNLKELEAMIKDSWYIRMILCQFLKGRQRKLNQIRIIKYQELITEEIIHQNLKQLKIYYVDYPNSNQGGQTDTSDPHGQFPIYINSFSEFQNSNYDRDMVLNYIFCTILHEIQHSIVRKIGLVKPEENSYPKHQQSSINIKLKQSNIKEQRNQIEDGGMFLQYFAFGGHMRNVKQFNYSIIKKLLNIKKNPLPNQDNSIWDCEGNFQRCQNMGILKSQNKKNKGDNKKLEQEKEQKQQQQIIYNINQALIGKINDQINEQKKDIQQAIAIIQKNFLAKEIQETINKSPSDNKTEFEKKQTEQFFNVFSQIAKQKQMESLILKKRKYQQWNKIKIKQKQKQSEKGQQESKYVAQVKQWINFFQKMCLKKIKNESFKRIRSKMSKMRAHSTQSDCQKLNKTKIIIKTWPCITHLNLRKK